VTYILVRPVIEQVRRSVACGGRDHPDERDREL